jgi:hypothetical protein
MPLCPYYTTVGQPVGYKVGGGCPVAGGLGAADSLRRGLSLWAFEESYTNFT